MIRKHSELAPDLRENISLDDAGMIRGLPWSLEPISRWGYAHHSTCLYRLRSDQRRVRFRRNLNGLLGEAEKELAT